MNNAAAITEVIAPSPTTAAVNPIAPSDHSAREIAQMSMLAEYLHETHTPDRHQKADAQPIPTFGTATIRAAA